MPAAVVVVAAAASGAAAYIGGGVVSALALGGISQAATLAIGVGVVAGGVTAIQGGSTSDVLKSAVLSGIGSYVGGQVASKITNSVSSATGVPAGTGLSAGAAGTTGLTAGSAGASGLSAGAGAGATLGAGITPTAIGIVAGNVAGRATQAAITGQDIGEGALFGLATSIGPALNESKDFKSLNKVTQDVIIASSQAAITGQDIPQAALTALVQSSNIVAKAIREVPGGERFIQRNPIYTRYIIDAVSSALTAELLNKNVNDALITSLASTTGRIIGQQFADAARSRELARSQREYEALQQKERELIMVQEQLDGLNKNRRYASQLNQFQTASKITKDSYRDYKKSVGRSEHHEEKYNKLLNLKNQENTTRYDSQLNQQRELYSRYVNKANAAAAQYEIYAPIQQKTYNYLEKNGYFSEREKIVNNFNSIKSEYDRLSNSVTATAERLATYNAELFTNTSRDLLTEIDRFASMEEPEIDADAPQYAENSQGMRIDIAGVPRVIYETKDKSVRINDALVMFLDEGGTGIYENAGTLTPEEFKELTGRTVNEALESSTPIQEPASVEDIAGIPSVTGTSQADLDALRFTVGVDLRKEASPQTGGGQAIYRPAETTGTTGTGGTSSTFQIIGRDSATGAEKVNVDGEGFTLIALPNNKQALVKDVGEVILYVEKDPVTNDTVLREEPDPVIATQIASGTSGATGDSDSTAVIQAPASPEPPMPEAPEAVGTFTPAEAEAQLQAAIADELEKLEKELADAQFAQQETQRTLERAQEQAQKLTQTRDVGRVSPETETALDAEIRALENQLAESAREAEIAAADKDRIGALQQGAGDLSDEDILSFLETGELPGGAGRPDAGFGTDGEGLPSGAIDGTGIDGIGAEGDGTGLGDEGEGEGFEMDEDVFEPAAEETELPQAIVSLGPEFGERPGTTPFGSRVTGQALESILGEKQPLFGGDDDEQRAVWNRRSLRLLSRALGI